MAFKSAELVLAVVLNLILLAVPTRLITSNLGEFMFYQKLSSSGINTKARLDNKYISTDDNWFSNYFVGDSKDNYKFVVGYTQNDRIWTNCVFGVSRDTYYSISRRDELAIIYDPDKPTECTIPDGVEISRLLLLATLIFAGFLIMLGIGFVFYIYKSFKIPKDGEQVKPTTDLGIGSNKVHCPSCNKLMTEGYMPTVGGVSWRDRDEPIGIPTILNGLPGTTFWLKRPLLHAYQCKDCEIITFKYGKN